MDGKEGKGREKGGRSDANLTGSTLGGKDVGESASTNAFSHYCIDNDGGEPATRWTDVTICLGVNPLQRTW